jgi:hypothetical protein
MSGKSKKARAAEAEAKAAEEAAAAEAEAKAAEEAAAAEAEAKAAEEAAAAEAEAKAAEEAAAAEAEAKAAEEAAAAEADPDRAIVLISSILSKGKSFTKGMKMRAVDHPNGRDGLVELVELGHAKYDEGD